MLALKNIAFITVLAYAAYNDCKKRIIPDRVHVLIILASFIAQFNLISSLKGLIFLPIPFVIAILINYDYVGGGDIKLITAIGFFLGFRKGLFAIIIGMSIVVFIALPIKKYRKKGYTIPMALYLAIGSFMSLLIKI